MSDSILIGALLPPHLMTRELPSQLVLLSYQVVYAISYELIVIVRGGTIEVALEGIVDKEKVIIGVSTLVLHSLDHSYLLHFLYDLNLDSLDEFLDVFYK